MQDKVITFIPNPRAVEDIRRRARVTEAHASALAELNGYRSTVPNTEIIDRALARLALMKRGAR